MRMAVVALSSTLLGPAASAYAEETWNFDPAAWHSGAPDKMYIAFRRNVLAIPATTNPFIGGSDRILTIRSGVLDAAHETVILRRT